MTRYQIVILVVALITINRLVDPLGQPIGQMTKKHWRRQQGKVAVVGAREGSDSRGRPRQQQLAEEESGGGSS
jgi:hypothetical protein